MTHIMRLAGLAFGVLAMPQAARAQAFPINSNVALQPAEGQWIYRTQLRWRKASVDATAPDTDVNIGSASQVLVYGWTSRIATVLGLPVLYRDRDTPAGDRDDFGVGDVRVIARYQVWKDLGYLASKSWTVLGGVEIPTDDDPFSSRSWDPVLGTVYTWRKDKYGFDADVVYQINTENDRDFEAGDVLRYDLAFQRRLWPEAYTADTRWTLTGLLELNGEWQDTAERNGNSLRATDSHQIFLGPGLVLAGKRTRVELGVQAPVYRDVGTAALQDDVRTVLGVTWTF